MKVFPEHPTLVYRPFTVNKITIFIWLTTADSCKSDLHDEQGTGLSFYTNREDTIAKQDMTVELSRINLEKNSGVSFLYA